MGKKEHASPIRHTAHSITGAIANEHIVKPRIDGDTHRIVTDGYRVEHGEAPAIELGDVVIQAVGDEYVMGVRANGDAAAAVRSACTDGYDTDR